VEDSGKHKSSVKVDYVCFFCVSTCLGHFIASLHEMIKETREAVYIYTRNTKPRKFNHCCFGKAISITCYGFL